MPLTGWMMSSAKNYSVSWFGCVHLAESHRQERNRLHLLHSTHEILSDILFAIAVLHILAALKHHFWNKDNVLVRMLPFTKSEK